MNGINKNGDGLRLTAAPGYLPETAGGNDVETFITVREQGDEIAALVCKTCDGTGWAAHATKGLTRCTETKGTPHK